MRINAVCHRNGISFIRADVKGVFGSIFCDFGRNFEVTDVDGECLCCNDFSGISRGYPLQDVCPVYTSDGASGSSLQNLALVSQISLQRSFGMSSLASFGQV